MKIVNKRPRHLLNKIQNVFINGKQDLVKTDKITQIIPWLPRFYGTKTTGNSQRRYRPHAWTVTFARWQRLPTEVSGCGQLAGGLKVGRRYKCVSKVWSVLYSLRSYNTLQTMLKPTLNGLQFSCWQYGSIFIKKISRNSERIPAYSSSRSSKVIELGINRKRICYFLLFFHGNFGRTSYRFWDIDV